MFPSLLARPVVVALVLAASFMPDGLLAAPAPAASASIERIAVGGTGGWDFLTFDPASQRLFIARSDRVQIWSAQAKKVIGEIAGTSGVHGVALAPDLNRGFTSNGRANSLSVFALDDLRVTNTIPIPGENPDAILYEPAFKRVYAFNGRSQSVTVVDAVALKVLATVALGGKPEVGVADGAGLIFVNIEDKAELVVLDQASNQVQARWPLHPCVEPTGLAIDPVHGHLFSVCANHKMMVVDAASGRLIADVPIGGEPDGAAFDPASGHVFSANGEGTLTVVAETQPQHFAVVRTIATQPRARTLALDPVSHRIYLVTASFGPKPAPTPADPRARAPMLNDSFTVLVVTPK